MGNTLYYDYDELSGVLISATDAGGVITRYTYNQYTDDLLTVTTGNSTNSYTYESGRVKTISHNTTGTENDVVYTFQYDEFGNDTATLIGNQVIAANTYADYNGNLIRTTYGNGDYVEPVYDSLDRVSAMKYNGVERYNWIYGADGNVGVHNDLVNNVSWRYEYNLNGDSTHVIGDNGTEFSYTYDNSTGNLVAARTTVGETTKITTYLYSPTGRLTGIGYSGGDSISYSYDGFDRVSGVSLNNGTDVVCSTAYSYLAALGENETTDIISALTNQGNSWSDTLSYTYDCKGNIETISENGEQKAKYYYDELNQLVREDNVWLGKTIAYTYDNGGNIQLVEEYVYTSGALDSLTAENSYTYLYGDSNWKDKLTSFNGNAITYDEIGNPLTCNGYTFTWQNGRELASISASDLSISYKYNADGIRTRKTVNGVTTNYTLEGTNVVYETNGTDSIWYSYDADGALVSMTLNSTTYYYITNLQGDITALTDSEGNIVVEYVYDSWGKLITVSGTLADTVGVKNPYRYRSYRYDTETGLYYLQSRYYNPEIKRFINADIYVDTGDTTLSTNMFAYCENNPVVCTDLFGYAPSLKVFVSLHNAVVRHAKQMLKKYRKITCLTQIATYYKKTGGRLNGFMDLYCKRTNEVWEVKRNNSRGIKAGIKQLNRYTTSFVRISKNNAIKPKVGENLSGTFYTSEGIWDIEYVYNKGLILYDYKANEARTATAGAVALVLLILTVTTEGAAAPAWAAAFA